MADSNSQCELQVPGRHKRKCEPCKKINKDTVAGLFCKTCAQYQCEECSGVHQIFEFMSNHEIVPADEAKPIQPTFDMKGMDKCKEHDKYFEVFCVDHDRLCCSTCVLVNHRACSEVREISKEPSRNTRNISDVESDLQKLQDKAIYLINVLENAKLTNDRLKILQENVDMTKVTLIERLDQFKTTVTERFKLATNIINPALESQLETANVLLGNLQRGKEFITSANLCGTSEQKFILTHVYNKTSVIQIEKSLENLQKDSYTTSCYLENSEALTHVINTDNSLGYLSINKEPLECTTFTLEKSVLLKLVTSVVFIENDADTYIPFFSGMDFFLDGRLAVVDCHNRKFYLLNNKLEKKNIFKMDDEPYGVCVISGEEVAITNGGDHHINFLHISKTNDISLTRKLKTKAKYDSICLMNETTFLVSTYDHGRPLRTITLEGEEKDFNYLPEFNYFASESTSTYIRTKKVAVLADKRNDTIYMYEVEGDCIGRRVIKHDDIKGANGMCKGPEDSVFVCCSVSNCIVQISSLGKVVASHKPDIESPQTVCMSNDGRRLAVFSDCPQIAKIQLFEICRCR